MKKFIVATALLATLVGCGETETAYIVNKTAPASETKVPTTSVAQTATTEALAKDPTTTFGATTTLPWAKRVVAVGDIACSPSSEATCAHDDVAQLVISLNPDAFLALGDIQYENGSYQSFVDVYDKSFGGLKSVTYPVPGNHEYYSKLSGYNQYFGENYLYYSHDIGPWHFVGLDSENITTNQVDWLTQDLANTPSKCIIAYWHRPRWSSGVHGKYKPVQAFWQALPEGSTVLSGHDHHYERFNPIDGITQFVVGTGGKSMRSVSSRRQESAITFDENFGVLVLDLYQDSYTWYFISIDNVVIDAGSSSC